METMIPIGHLNPTTFAIDGEADFICGKVWHITTGLHTLKKCVILSDISVAFLIGLPPRSVDTAALVAKIANEDFMAGFRVKLVIGELADKTIAGMLGHRDGSLVPVPRTKHLGLPETVQTKAKLVPGATTDE
ncbi:MULTISPECIES: hypothetical protein [unclassified Thioalkalivibrio]|uniref:hypothetical protein n=1 Tax=unclassified Thioalkalivibrio TaxID=2621013 RepID=UPI0003760AFA|nr:MULTISPECIES: hypothetical protein [unclassified Thioalkalivibrio]